MKINVILTDKELLLIQHLVIDLFLV